MHILFVEAFKYSLVLITVHLYSASSEHTLFFPPTRIKVFHIHAGEYIPFKSGNKIMKCILINIHTQVHTHIFTTIVIITDFIRILMQFSQDMLVNIYLQKVMFSYNVLSCSLSII